MAGLLGLAMIAINLWHGWGEQQFSFLAASFASGRLDFLEMPGSWGDAVPYQGKYYWPLGPLPAMILVPWVWLFHLVGCFFYQGYLQVFLLGGVAWLVFQLARGCGFAKYDATWLSLAWFGGSTFLGVALCSWSWSFAHVVATFLVFLAIWEYTTKRRYWVIGGVMGLAAMTRLTAGLGVVFFALMLLGPPKRNWRELGKLLVPVVLAASLLGGYNYARFGDWQEQGYRRQVLPEHADKARSYGVFSPVHIPGNLYFMLLATPEPVPGDGVSRVLKWPFIHANQWGMSLFLTCPYLLRLFWLRYKGWEAWSAMLTVLGIGFPILLYYGIGWRQFGYRYALDFLPWLHFLLLRNWGGNKEMSAGVKGLVLLSTCGNMFLIADIVLCMSGFYG